MYSSIRIDGYRGLGSFRMERLGRVNLLVGTNNSGKTSILECIELLRSAGNPHVLSAIAARRGEWGRDEREDVRTPLFRQDALDVKHLFTNHKLPGEIVVEADCIPDVQLAGWNDRVGTDSGGLPRSVPTRRTRRVCDCTKRWSIPSWTLQEPSPGRS